MDPLIKVVKHLHMEVHLGEDEIKLVRKKLKWNYEAFKIPNELLSEWRKIGQNALLKAKKHENKYKKADSKNLKI